MQTVGFLSLSQACTSEYLHKKVNNMRKEELKKSRVGVEASFGGTAPPLHPHLVRPSEVSMRSRGRCEQGKTEAPREGRIGRAEELKKKHKKEG